jgi:hypothetical protein
MDVFKYLQKLENIVSKKNSFKHVLRLTSYLKIENKSNNSEKKCCALLVTIFKLSLFNSIILKYTIV